jgi:hypothetical protein
MYWKDHAPPHFHAKYADQEITVNIRTGEVEGTISTRAHRLIEEWRTQHIDELLDDWKRAENKEKLNRIEPLE